MPPDLSPLERLILFAADDDGRLAMPRGEKDGIKAIRDTLARMKKKGLVCREKGRRTDNLPYSLTLSARKLRDDITWICLENYEYAGFCPDCIAETTDESPGGTRTINGIGTELHGKDARCPTCFSVIKKKFFCVFFIPIIPGKAYRIKQLPMNRYLGRFMPPEKRAASQARLAAGKA
jgi:hypothetical protein